MNTDGTVYGDATKFTARPPSGSRAMCISKSVISGLILSAATAAFVCAQESPRIYQAKEEKLPKEVDPQPVSFSHKKHTEAGIACKYCHLGVEERDWAGQPKTGQCMQCHQSIKADSPEIRKLASMLKSGDTIHWVRIYEVPGYVFFSHANHLKGGVGCQTCHGPVQQRDVLAKEVSTSMTACMNCHAARNVSNDCHFCHSLGH